MQAISPEALLRQLTWRYAVKSFDPTRTIPAELWSTLEQAMVLAPSSYGLQPWRFYVIDDPGTRAALRAASYNQPQITDASHMVLFARRTQLTPRDIDTHVARVAEVRGITTDALAGLRDMMLGSIADPATLPGGGVDAYTRSQTYIALGFLLFTAAALGVDACPMEGFDPAKYDDILGLRPQGYSATVVATVGYRSAGDWLAPLAKVRARHEDIVRHV
ncbi:MAG: NAD(P)H-dependent oxidoreductase [Phycisphaerales bacterium]